jgi:hypothetical protein
VEGEKEKNCVSSKIKPPDKDVLLNLTKCFSIARAERVMRWELYAKLITKLCLVQESLLSQRLLQTVCECSMLMSGNPPLPRLRSLVVAEKWITVHGCPLLLSQLIPPTVCSIELNFDHNPPSDLFYAYFKGVLGKPKKLTNLKIYSSWARRSTKHKEDNNLAKRLATFLPILEGMSIL